MLCGHQTRNIDTTQPEVFQEDVAMCMTHIHLDVLKIAPPPKKKCAPAWLWCYVLPRPLQSPHSCSCTFGDLTSQNTDNKSDELDLFFTDERFKWRPGSSVQTGAASGRHSKQGWTRGIVALRSASPRCAVLVQPFKMVANLKTRQMIWVL